MQETMGATMGADAMSAVLDRTCIRIAGEGGLTEEGLDELMIAMVEVGTDYPEARTAQTASIVRGLVRNATEIAAL